MGAPFSPPPCRVAVVGALLSLGFKHALLPAFLSTRDYSGDVSCWKRCSTSIGPRCQEEAPPGLTGEDECEKTWKGLELATHRDLASGLIVSQDLMAAQKDVPGAPSSGRGLLVRLRCGRGRLVPRCLGPPCLLPSPPQLDPRPLRPAHLPGDPAPGLAAPVGRAPDPPDALRAAINAVVAEGLTGVLGWEDDERRLDRGRGIKSIHGFYDDCRSRLGRNPPHMLETGAIPCCEPREEVPLRQLLRGRNRT